MGNNNKKTSRVRVEERVTHVIKRDDHYPVYISVEKDNGEPVINISNYEDDYESTDIPHSYLPSVLQKLNQIDRSLMGL